MNTYPTMKLFGFLTLTACLFVGLTRCFASELDFHYDNKDRMREEDSHYDDWCGREDACSRSERNESVEIYHDHDGGSTTYESGGAWV